MNSSMTALNALCRDSSIGYATYVLFQTPRKKLRSPYIKTTYPDQWISYYLQNGYYETDPIVNYATNHETPKFWHEIASNKNASQIYEMSQKFGILPEGFVIPVQSKYYDRGFLSINAAVEKAGFTAFIEENIGLIAKAATLIQKLALEEVQSEGGDTKGRLSPREIECLGWISEGKTYPEIAIIMEVSEHTIRGYAKTIRLKLDCATIAQAVSKAFRLNII